ncbi:MAG: hypothetical protein ACI909_003111 [Planctomycetota bacterium]|jgi:hypothetical protein
MRLSLSGKHTGDEYALEAAIGHDANDGGLPHGDLLNEYVEAVCSHDDERTILARQQLVLELGEAAMVDAAAVIAAFNGYPRAADATGIPLEEFKEVASEEMRAALGLDLLNHSKTA